MRINEKKKQSRCPPYTSKVIKAGALLADTKTLLSHSKFTTISWPFVSFGEAVILEP
jgi:hypothetical protein